MYFESIRTQYTYKVSDKIMTVEQKKRNVKSFIFIRLETKQ